MKRRCDAYTTDHRASMPSSLKLANPDDHVVLPEIISKEPLGPAVRQGDDRGSTSSNGRYFALLNAEELGVTQANVEEHEGEPTNPEIKRLLGAEGDFGEGIGLDNDWVVQHRQGASAIMARSSSAMSARTTKLKIARGLNALWSKGGLQYAPPIR